MFPIKFQYRKLVFPIFMYIYIYEFVSLMNNILLVLYQLNSIDVNICIFRWLEILIEYIVFKFANIINLFLFFISHL